MGRWVGWLTLFSHLTSFKSPLGPVPAQQTLDCPRSFLWWLGQAILAVAGWLRALAAGLASAWQEGGVLLPRVVRIFFCQREACRVRCGQILGSWIFWMFTKGPAENDRGRRTCVLLLFRRPEHLAPCPQGSVSYGPHGRLHPLYRWGA